MAKEVILLEYQLVEKGGDKVVSTVTDITEAWEKSGKAATAALSEKQIDSATAKLTTFNAQVEKTATGFTSAKSELRELEKIITSGKLQGNDLKQAVAQAAKLKDRIGDVRQEISRLSSDTRIFDTFVEGGRAVAAAFSVAQGAAALFGDENKDLQKSILKVQGALALLTGAQELANIVTKQGGLATQAYGVALKVVEGIQKAFAISAAASWAIATAGVTLLVAGVASLIYYFNQADDAAEEATQRQNEFADSLKGTTREAANLRIELEKSKGNVSDISAQLQKNNNARQAAIEDANATEKELVNKLNAEIAKADGESLAKLLEERTKIRQEAEANRKAINQKFFLQDELALQEHENNKTEISKKAEQERLKQFGVTMKTQIEQMRNSDKSLEEGLFATSDHIKEFVEEVKANPELEIPPLITEQTVDDSKRHGDEMAADAASAYRQGLEDTAKALAEKKALESAYFAFASSAASSLASITSSAFQQESQTLQAEKDRQLQTVGDNTKAREAIEKRFAIKSAEIKRKQAIADKIFAVASIGINLAQAIMKQLTVTPLPAGAAFVGLLGATAGLQLAAVLSTPLPEIPKFKKGVIGFKGKGTQTSDENLVMISNNESILKGKATEKYGEELNAANNLELEDLIYHKYLLPALKQAGAADKDGNLYDDWLLRRTIKAGQQADRENSKYIATSIISAMKENSYNARKHYVNN